jgi:hypothetical protein
MRGLPQYSPFRSQVVASFGFPLGKCFLGKAGIFGGKSATVQARPEAQGSNNDSYNHVVTQQAASFHNIFLRDALPIADALLPAITWDLQDRNRIAPIWVRMRQKLQIGGEGGIRFTQMTLSSRSPVIWP